MRAVAAIPATALLVGSALALARADVPPVAWALALAAAVGVLLAAWQTANAGAIVCALWASFCCGGSLLTADAWQRAWRPTLRLAFEEVVARQRLEASQKSARDGRPLSEEPEASVWLSGVLRSDASPVPNGVSLSLDVREIRHALFPNGLEVRGGALITVGGTLAGQWPSGGSLPSGAPAPYGAWRAGRTVGLPAQLRRPSRYLNEGGEDAERSLARRGTTVVGSAKSGALVEVLARGSPLAEAAARIRAFVRRAMARHVGRWSPRAAAIVGAIVIGDRTGLDDALEQRLQEAGTYHVIAISGGNIAILVGLTLVAFRVTGLLGSWAMLTAIAGLVSYAYVVGGGRSVERATLTAVLFLAGRAIDQRGAPSNILAAAAAMLVVSGPLTIADPGFLLTFGATVGILALATISSMPGMSSVSALDQAAAHTRRRPWIVAAALSLWRASFGAEAMLLPIGAVVFSRVTLAGLLLNFAAIPLMAVAQMAGMVIVPLSVVWADAATTVGWVAYAASEGLVRSAELVEWMPALTWRVAPPAAWVVCVYYGGLVVLWRARRQADRTPSSGTAGPRWPRLALVVPIAAAMWIAIEPWRVSAERGAGRLHATFIDVGQGDATWIRFPTGQTLLVDAGGLSGNASFDIGDRVVAPVLRRHGVGRLNALVLTHGDADHIGGATAVLTEFRPREVWEGIPVPRLPTLQDLQSIADRIRTPWRTVQPGDRLQVGEVEVVVRHPAPPDWERQEVRNDDSIVLDLVWRDVSIWLTGDIGRDTEKLLVPAVRASHLRIVKVPHHGSLTSSSAPFVRALGARIAVVSVGRSNTFGHPVPAVLDRYRQTGASIFRTDQDGAVTLTTDGRVVDVETVSGRRARYR